MYHRVTLLLSCYLLLSLSFLKLEAQVEQAQSPITEGQEEAIIKPIDLRLKASDSLHIAQAKELSLSTTKTWTPKGSKALLWSIIPGGGQIYNRKYWKLPIVWGSLMTCAYFISFNGRMYNEYHAAYRDLMSADPSKNTAWLAFAPKGAKPEDFAQYSNLKGTLQRGNDYYRRYRDLSIVLAIGIYGLSMLDAYVDAELFTFDISPDLSMRVSPTLIPATGQTKQTYHVGMGCQLTF